MNTTVGDIAGNKKLILDYIVKAKKEKAELVVFPELTLTGYPPEDLLYKQIFVDDNINAFNEIVPQTKGISVILGFVHKQDQKIYNAAAMIHNSKVLGIYRKHELPNYGVFDEKRYFSKGNDVLVFDQLKESFAVNICEDIWVENSIAQKQAEQGAKILINISASPYDYKKQKQRESALFKCSQKTGTMIIYVNLIGGQDEVVYDGGSMVFSSKGEKIYKAKIFEDDFFIFDTQKNSQKQALTQTDDTIENMYKALVLGSRDYIRKNNFKKVIIGISGGIDSALVAAIACDAIGKENVVGVSMPSRYNSEETRSDAKILAKNLGIEFKEISIEDIYKVYVDSLNKDHEFKQKGQDITEENIQARIRGNILMAQSNKFGYLVLSTSNKSESAVGYTTLYGDMSGGFAPIQDVYKTNVFKLSKHINAVNNKEIIPLTIIKRAPSAELKIGQKDSDSLPDYELLDDILKDYLEKNESIKQMSAKHERKIVEKVVGMVDNSEYKRRQAAPGVKITRRNFGKDWRVPITNGYKEK
ncbi:MAG: NAD+ synthase [Candidatus Omnitrophica bacterium]|nr:NAD+ synthase [Candidatus Omnitrophota bacterium]